STSLLPSVLLPPHPRPTLFPYTTLFRSHRRHLRKAGAGAARQDRRTVRVRSAPRQGDEHGRSLRRHSLGEGQSLFRPWRKLRPRSEEHTSELQSQSNLVCRLLLEKKNKE